MCASSRFCALASRKRPNPPTALSQQFTQYIPGFSRCHPTHLPDDSPRPHSPCRPLLLLLLPPRIRLTSLSATPAKTRCGQSGLLGGWNTMAIGYSFKRGTSSQAAYFLPTCIAHCSKAPALLLCSLLLTWSPPFVSPSGLQRLQTIPQAKKAPWFVFASPTSDQTD